MIHRTTIVFILREMLYMMPKLDVVVPRGTVRSSAPTVRGPTSHTDRRYGGLREEFKLFRRLKMQEELPTEVAGWTNLRRLDLAENKLEEIPQEVRYRTLTDACIYRAIQNNNCCKVSLEEAVHPARRHRLDFPCTNNPQLTMY